MGTEAAAPSTPGHEDGDTLGHAWSLLTWTPGGGKEGPPRTPWRRETGPEGPGVPQDFRHLCSRLRDCGPHVCSRGGRLIRTSRDPAIEGFYGLGTHRPWALPEPQAPLLSSSLEPSSLHLPAQRGPRAGKGLAPRPVALCSPCGMGGVRSHPASAAKCAPQVRVSPERQLAGAQTPSRPHRGQRPRSSAGRGPSSEP